MKRISFYILLCLLGLPAVALGDPARGEKLFRSVTLGSNGKSCLSCHDQGTGLDNIAAYDSPTLQGIINICIEDALKGKPFKEGAQELKDLQDYLRLFKAN